MGSKEYIIDIIAGIVELNPKEITEETKLVDIAHDSIKLFELFIRLENQLEGARTYDEIAHIESIGDVVRFIDGYSLHKRV